MESRTAYTFPFSRYPAVRIALLLIAGIVGVQLYQPHPFLSILVVGIAVLIYAFAEWKVSRQISLAWPRLATCSFLLIIIGFGMVRAHIQQYINHSPLKELITVSPWEEVVVTGEITTISSTSSGKPRWEFQLTSILLDTLEVKINEPLKARILTDSNYNATIGDHSRFLATIIPIGEKRNPADFDYQAYLASRGIHLQLRLDSLISLQPNHSRNRWVWWREKALQLADQNFNQQTAALAKALLLGYKQELDGESKTAFARAGLSHIMAVSGLHVGFIIAPFWLLIPYFWTRTYGKLIGLVILITILVSYAGITGFSPSVTRASVMAGFITYGKLFHKVNNSINLTAAAAIILLIVNPHQLFQIGFQLSFSAVLIILLMLPVLQTTLPYWLRTHWLGKPLMVIIVSVVVQFGLYPLQVYYFGEVSLVSPLANALFVPFLGIVVPLSLIALIVSSLFPILGFILNYPSMIFLQAMADFVALVSAWKWAWFNASLPHLLFVVFWLFLVFFISSLRIAALRWKMLIGALTVVCTMQFISLVKSFQPAKLTITFFDVGQGDSALLKTPSGKHVLIDAGVWSPTYNSGKSVIIPHLRESGISNLDAVVLSHPHSDHIGGILDLISEVSIDTIYNSGHAYDSNLYHTYINLAEGKNIPVKAVQSGDLLPIDPAMLFLVLGPDGTTYNEDPNQHSVVLNIIYGKTEILFAGDAGEAQEQRLVKNYGHLLNADLLKVGHHGSKTSSGHPFLSRVTPRLSVISLAERNRFGHPHRQSISNLKQSGTKLLFTSRERGIILTSDGSTIERVKW
ncbi:MAG: DNA internalization-related competence protein ComEC/Rec2 [Balneolaceae bacterium]|nr:DNA internalization-related competence protein ComEC/Rec2 [Balneolaceae bacterium]